MNNVLQLLELDVEISYTAEYEKEHDGVEDFRSAIHPKIKKHVDDRTFSPPEYHQVFQDKIGFLPNLSIVDLLFNEGRGSVAKLREGISS